MPSLKVIHPDSELTEHEFGDATVRIGQDADNMIILNDLNILPHHAEIYLREDAWWLRDWGSSQGITTQENAVQEVLVKDGDVFEIGGHLFQFMLSSRENLDAASVAATLHRKSSMRTLGESSSDPKVPSKKKTTRKKEAKSKAAASSDTGSVIGDATILLEGVVPSQELALEVTPKKKATRKTATKSKAAVPPDADSALSEATNLLEGDALSHELASVIRPKKAPRKRVAKSKSVALPDAVAARNDAVSAPADAESASAEASPVSLVSVVEAAESVPEPVEADPASSEAAVESAESVSASAGASIVLATDEVALAFAETAPASAEAAPIFTETTFLSRDAALVPDEAVSVSIGGGPVFAKSAVEAAGSAPEPVEAESASNEAAFEAAESLPAFAETSPVLAPAESSLAFAETAPASAEAAPCMAAAEVLSSELPAFVVTVAEAPTSSMQDVLPISSLSATSTSTQRPASRTHSFAIAAAILLSGIGVFILWPNFAKQSVDKANQGSALDAPVSSTRQVAPAPLSVANISPAAVADIRPMEDECPRLSVPGPAPAVLPAKMSPPLASVDKKAMSLPKIDRPSVSTPPPSLSTAVPPRMAEPPAAPVVLKPVEPSPAAEPVWNKVVLLQRSLENPTNSPLISSDLQHVLHLSKPQGANPALMDLKLDDQVIRSGIDVATERNLWFSTDGSKWLAYAEEFGGRKVLLLPDRSLKIEGTLQSLLGNRDFSTLAYVARSGDHDLLHINGAVVSSYYHITSLRLSEKGGHWAYIALKYTDTVPEGVVPGERVVTDSYSSPIHDHISQMTLSRDGARLAYVAHDRAGGQTLFLDGKAVHEVTAQSGQEISSLTFASTSSSFAWGVLSQVGATSFHLDDWPPVQISATAQAPEAADSTFFSHEPAVGRILFSDDGRHVAYAAVGRSSVLLRDGVMVGKYPSLQLDSLTFSPDGTRLAFVTLHPLRAATTSADGLVAQPHAAILRVDGNAVQTVPVLAHKQAGAFPISFGGLTQLQFSPDSTSIAYVRSLYPQGAQTVQRQELWVNGAKAWQEQDSIHAFRWANEKKLQLVSKKSDSLLLYSLEWNRE